MVQSSVLDCFKEFSLVTWKLLLLPAIILISTCTHTRRHPFLAFFFFQVKMPMLLPQKKQFIWIKTELDKNFVSHIESRMVSYSEIFIIISQLWNSLCGVKACMRVKSLIKSRKILCHWCNWMRVNQSKFKYYCRCKCKESDIIFPQINWTETDHTLT